MTWLYTQPDGHTIRKVQASSNVVLLAVPLSAILAPVVVEEITWIVPDAIEHVRLSLEIGLTAAFTWVSSWAAGYYTKARIGE